MNPPPWRPCVSRFTRRASVFYAILLLFVWGGAVWRGMFPFLENSIHVDGLLILGAAVPLAAILVAMLCGIGPQRVCPDNQPVRPWLAGLWLLAAAGTVLYALGIPVRLGTRLGGKLGISTQPVTDLIHSPHVAAIAATGEPASLPREKWPASLQEWKTQIWSVDVSPHTDGPPDIRIHVGSRGARVHGVYILSSPPGDTADDICVQWMDNVWLTRRLGGD